MILSEKIASFIDGLCGNPDMLNITELTSALSSLTIVRLQGCGGSLEGQPYAYYIKVLAHMRSILCSLCKKP